MEKLANKLATKSAKELNLDEEKKEVIAYGAFAIIQSVVTVILVIFTGWIFNVIIEALIVCFTVSILRKYSGGAHASSPNTCTFMSILICIGQAIIFKYVIQYIINLNIICIICFVVFLMSYYLMYKLAPVDSPAKPIKKQCKINKMKKGSILTISIYLVIVVLNAFLFFTIKDKRFLVYSLCFCGGVAWQTFTLTKLGHRFIHKIDSFFHKIFIFKKREGI